jgi:hypothetical protein
MQQRKTFVFFRSFVLSFFRSFVLSFFVSLFFPFSGYHCAATRPNGAGGALLERRVNAWARVQVGGPVRE